MGAADSPVPFDEAYDAPLPADAAVVGLDRLRRSQVRGLRVPLVEIRGTDHVPSRYALQVTVTCLAPGRHHLEFRPDFGDSSPPSAKLVVLKNRYELSAPVPIVRGGVVQEAAVVIDVEPAVERLVLWITTVGAPDVPRHLAAAVRIRAAVPEPPADDDLDTLRLPSTKARLVAELGGTLRCSDDESLVTLGRLMGAADFDDRLLRLGALIDMEASFRLLEAAVRTVHLVGETGGSLPPIDFRGLSCDDPVGACLVVFHPDAPTDLVGACFVRAYEDRIYPCPTSVAPFWNNLARAAAVRLAREAPRRLEEELEATRGAADPGKHRLLRMIVEWARRRETLAPPADDFDVDAALAAIRTGSADAARAATFDLLAHLGLVGVSRALD